MKENRTIHIAIVNERVHEDSIMEALSPVADCTSVVHDDIIHITATTTEERSSHPDKDCALTADIITELDTEDKIEGILDGLGCCYVLMPKESIFMTTEGVSRAGGLSDLLRAVHRLNGNAKTMVKFSSSQDIGFALRNALFYPTNALFRTLLLDEDRHTEKLALSAPDDIQAVSRFWAYGEYRDHPLCFVDIGKPAPEQIIDILSQYDEWYGNTDQDTEDYALEFQILTRMLLSDGKLLVNPKYLDVTEPDVIEWQDAMLADIGAPVAKDGSTAFALVRRMNQNEINALYSAISHEPSLFTEGNCFVYGGYHFTPLQQIIGKNTDMKALVRRIVSNSSLGFSTYSWRRFPYSYDDFYKAAGTIGAGSCDLFRCLETGLVYIPGENELFIYSGKVDKSSILN